MKNLVLSLMLSVSMATCAPAVPAVEYDRDAIIIYLDYSADLVYAMDADGETWAFYGVEDWQVWDLCRLTMEDNGTQENIYDDIITRAIYAGYISPLEM